MKFEVWDDGVWAGDENMCMDWDLLQECESSWQARVYGWEGNWVSLGRFQKKEGVLRKRCRLPYVIRPTGGKAVLHGHDVTLGMAVGLGVLGLDGRRIKPIYRAVVGPIVTALRACHVPAVLAEETPFARGKSKVGDCFAHVSANDVVLEGTGEKICGCALRISDGAVLVQASIPVMVPGIDPKEVFEEAAVVTIGGSFGRAEFVAGLVEALQAL